MLFIPPTDFELTSYNEIKYKKNITITQSLISMKNKLFFSENIVENNINFSISKSNLISADIEIINNDFEISNLSTWEDNFDDFEIDNLKIKLLKNNSYKIKSKIININHFKPQIIID
ncbi:MAG: hypothetical protein JST62_09310 [Bacteroidetes bacterium]|nr:hypothetical protein [Bacteroidota bacterium]